MRDNPNGYVVQAGVLKETKKTPQLKKTATVEEGKEEHINVCGDGTVPYFFLQHVRTWSNVFEVSIDELEGAEHREILIDYVCRKAPAAVDNVV
jgi:hypothetical protein